MKSVNIKTNSPLQTIPEDYAVGSTAIFKIPKGFDKGKRMFYYDFVPENLKSDHTVLFVHGNPECSYTYRHIRDELIKNSAGLRIVAMDHIGFGLSDKATYEMIDKHHAYNLTLLIEKLQLKKIILVVHDWGGPIGIGSLINQYKRVEALLVLNSTVFPMPKNGYKYTNFPFKILPWSIAPKIIPNTLWGGMAAYVVSNGHPQGFFTFLFGVLNRLWKHGTNSFDKNNPEYVWSQMLRDYMNSKSSQRQVKQTPVWGYGYKYNDKVIGEVSNIDFYKNIQETISEKWKNIPVSGFFGKWDACGKDEVVHQWLKALPQMKDNLYLYKDVGHFIEEYKGAKIAEQITKFI